jgi:hypothetical protein
MTSAAIQQSLHLLHLYPVVATEASNRARYGSKLKSYQFGVQTGETKLKHLLHLPPLERKSIVEDGPYIDTYLGDTRVYKRTSRTLLFASCPDIGRFLEPKYGHLAVCLPEGHTNALAVKLAVLYMEQYLLNPRVRDVPWKVVDDFPSYIYLAELFAFVGMPHVASKVEAAIVRRMRERPLQFDHICGIWAREDVQHPSRYAEAMADNIFTFTCVAEIEHFLLTYDIEPMKTYKECIEDGIWTVSGPAG